MSSDTSIKVDKNTKYADFQFYDDYILNSSREELTAASIEEMGDYYDIKIGDFIQLMHLTEADIEQRFDTVFAVYWLRGFKDFLEDFVKTVNNLTVKQTAKEAAASDVCYDVDFDEGMLVFTRSYFGLHSFKEAEEITIGEFIMAKKDAYNSTMFERKLSDITMSKPNKSK